MKFKVFQDIVIWGVRRVPSENDNIAQVVANRENELSSLM